MRLRTGSATHVGQIREINQDRLYVGETLAAVADGMGGHVGGEKAAALAVAEISGVRGVISPHRLVEVAQAANDRVYQAAQAPELRGMGTTLVMASFDPAIGVITLANVGDSRGYLLRDGTLRQITLDHSLVEELVRQGRLSEDEARTHPQRNMVTRVLGIGATVEVDLFNIDAAPGDRVVICSDGLSNEVEDEAMVAILAAHPDPEEAAAVLVDAALAAGGRDNITVVVLDVIDDEIDSQIERETDEEAVSAAIPLLTSGSAAEPVDIDDVAPIPRRRPARRGLALLLAVVGVLGMGGTATAWYARSAWYVDEADGVVVIMRGRPGGLLWLQPSVVEETGLVMDDLDDASRERVTARRVWSSPEQARRLVENLSTTTVAPPGGPGTTGSPDTTVDDGD